MIVKQCRFFNTKDNSDKAFANWSRAYEYKYCLDVIRADPKLRTIHNSCAGFAPIHKQFSEELDKIPNRTIYNSDVAETLTNREFSNFFVYDLLAKCDKVFDCTTAISTVEDFGAYDAVKLAFENLVEQSKRRVLITCDYPGIKTEWLREILSLPPNHSFGMDGALTGANSVVNDLAHSHLMVLLIDLIL